jgi:hypothetical protein
MSFAQIEADPFSFNISRYESYFEERRPFFTEGNEVFMPSGKERSSGFYSPLELFYSRRIGRKLPDPIPSVSMFFESTLKRHAVGASVPASSPEPKISLFVGSKGVIQGLSSL